ncbi:Zinc finger CCCH domain-containing protein 3 [Candida tropicalis]
MCEKGSLCKYVHDKDMIRICPLFLAGKCYGRDCLLSHTPNDCNTPVCRYYLDRTCTNSNCKYRHFKPDHYDDPNYEILTCRPFAITGYCARGKKCPFLHLPSCPDFEEDNYCRYGRECSLPHRFTLRVQEQIATRSNKYVRDETVISEEVTPSPQKIVISSYTVDPKLLFAVDSTGNYQYYIDNEGNQTSNDSKEFLIELSESEDNEDDFDSESDNSEEDDCEGDDLELNGDYVGV